VAQLTGFSDRTVNTARLRLSARAHEGRQPPSDSEVGSGAGQEMGRMKNDEWKKIGGRREARTRDLRVANEPGEGAQPADSKRASRRKVRSLWPRAKPH